MLSITLNAQDPPPKFEFIGINVFQETATDIPPVHSIREYHWWESEQGDLDDGNPPYPDNIYKFSPSYRGNDFDDYYNTLIGNGHETVMPSFTLSVPYIYEASNPVCPAGLPIFPVLSNDPNGERPQSYFAHADYMFHYAARYGSETLNADILEKRVEGSQGLSGLGLIEFMEDRNEPDLENFCEGTDTYIFSPAQYAAFSSANYDGHGGSMIYDHNDVEYPVGIKNADPNMQVVLGGLSDFDYGYLDDLKDAWEDIRAGMDPIYPTDVFNFHHYSDKNNTGFNFLGHGFSPEEDIVENRNLRQQMEDMVNHVQTEFGPQYNCWLTEFGYDTNPFSFQAAIPDYTFDPPIDVPGNGSVTNFRTSLIGAIVPNWLAISEEDRNFLMGIIYETQGQWIVRSLLEGSASGFEKMFIYQDRDVQAEPTCFDGECERSGPGQTFEFSGIYESSDEGLTPKTSYYYVSTMSQILAGLSFSEDLSLCQAEEESNPAFIIDPEKDCPKVYKYVDADVGDDIEGVTTYAFWSPTSTNKAAYAHQITGLPENITSATIVTMVDGDEDGSFEIVPVLPDGRVNVLVTERPKFLILEEIETCQTPELVVIDANPQDCQTAQLTWNIPASPDCEYDHFELFFGRDIDISNPEAPLLNQLTLFDGDIPPTFSEGIFTQLDPNTCYWFYVRSVSTSGEASELSGAAAATLPEEDLCWIDVLNEPGITISVDNSSQNADGFFEYGINQGDCIGCNYFNAENYDPIGWNYFASGNNGTGGSFMVNFPSPYDIHAIHFFDDESSGFMEVSFLISGIWSDPKSVETVDFEEWGQLSNFEINGAGATAIRINFTTPETRIAKLVICGEPIGGDLAGCFSDEYNTCNADAEFTLSACDLTVEGVANMAGTWDMGDGTTYTDTETVNHTYVGPGTYEVTFTTENPCESTCGEEITLPASSGNLNANFTFDDPGCNPVVSFTAIEPLWDHEWDFAGQETSTEVNPTHNFGQAGDYLVTHTVTVSGCAVSTETETVTIETCTPNLNCAPATGEVHVYSGETLVSEIVADIGFTTSPQIGTIYLEADERIEIEGRVIVDMNVGIVGGNWFMYPGSEIRVNAGLQVVTEDVSFSGCDGMWKGIHFTGNNEYSSKNGSSISDALIGIFMNNPVFAGIFSINFDRNFIGVYLQGNTDNVRMARNNFTCSQNLLPNTTEFAEGVPTNLFPTPNTRSYAGVFSRHSGVLSVGIASNVINVSSNTFDGLANGIISTNADALMVNKVVMRNITRGDYGGAFDGNPAFSGYGVHAVDLAEVTLTGKLIDPANPTGEPEMENVVDGVFVQNAGLNISNAYFLNTERGAIMEMSDNTKFSVETSNITSASACIFMNFNNNNEVDVSNNFLTSGDPAQSQCSAIEILQMENGNQANQRISTNIIRTLGSGGESNGIRLVGVSNFAISDNDIMLDNLNSNAGSRNGVLTFSDNDNLLFSCNQVYSTSPTAADWLWEPVVGFNFFGLNNSTMSCNNFQQTRNGIRFNGDGDQVMANNQLTGNIFNRHRNALRIGEDVFLGAQPYAGNTWSGEEVAGVRYDGDGDDLIANLDQNRFTVNGSPNSNVWPESIIDGTGDDILDWFRFGDDQGNSTCEFTVCTPDQQLNLPEPPCNEIALTYLNEEYSFLSYSTEKSRQLNRWLHDGLVGIAFDESTNCNDQVELYYNQHQMNSLARLSSLENVIHNSYQSDAYTNGWIARLREEAEIFQNRIAIYEEEVSQTNNSADITALEAERLITVRELGIRMRSIRELLNAQRSYRKERKTGLKNNNQAIGIEHYYDEIEKAINRTYLETIYLGNRKIEETDKQTVISIAALCPIQGGPESVYRARSLAKFFNLSYALPKNCSEEEAEKKSSAGIPETLNQFNLYPNPTTNELRIDYKETEIETNLLVEIRDLTGQLVMSKQLESDQSSRLLFLGDQPSGIYLISVLEDREILFSEKLIIQR